ncbi:ribonuclease D [Planctomicrobium piriforme]|uniref:ribonuclease D n=1 Tax=Planctomicrobium piriforme TaxID=1576369 RepID=UPI000B888A8E|nr:HRDC domain-containing protein [Planctomicrobium piriforme]
MSLITTQSDFQDLCDQIRTAGLVAFDTEFVSETFYRPRLCLLQFSLANGACFGVDPFLVDDLSEWWEIMTDETTTVIVHGGREEIRFCQFATGRRPRLLIDVQVAEGLRSRGFPISYSNLITRVLSRSIQHGKETRTDWQHRPLTQQQLDYALEDVRYLPEVWETQKLSLQKQGRLDWAYAEIDRLIDSVLAEEDREGWVRLPGYGRLSRKEMAVAKALFLWRNSEAERLNRPQRRILRDDLLVELAHRQPKSVRELNMTRDMNRRDYQQYADRMVEIIKEAGELSGDQLPQKPTGTGHPAQDEVLARILGLALANQCQELCLSMTLVATAADLKDFVRWHVFDKRRGPLPRLMEGWRAGVCGQLLADVLDGNVTLRVSDPKSEYPLEFVRDRDGAK